MRIIAGCRDPATAKTYHCRAAGSLGPDERVSRHGAKRGKARFRDGVPLAAQIAWSMSVSDAMPWPLATNQLLEQRGYSDFHKIGYGSYSTVYRATKTNKQKPADPPIRVAIKFIDLNTTSANYKKKFFPRELEATKSLKNAHLVPIYEVISEKGGMRHFVVMELCKSDLLKEVEVQVRIPEDQGRVWCRQMVQGLQYLHSQNWVHRDVKIENILINFKNDALVSDFTFMRQQRPPILSNTFCGSLQYAAPEILNSQTSYDGFKADIWSLGIIMFAIHSGSMPVVNESDATLIRTELNDIQHRIRNGVGAFQMSANLKDLLSKILVIDPNGRISLENALKHVWFTEKSAKKVKSAEKSGAASNSQSTKVIPLPKVRASAVFVRPASEKASHSQTEKGKVPATPSQTGSSKSAATHSQTGSSKTPAKKYSSGQV